MLYFHLFTRHKCDGWGMKVGCVLHWMLEGKTVFEPNSETEQLTLMQIVTSNQIPPKLVSRSPRRHLFDEDGLLKTKASRKSLKLAKPIRDGLAEDGLCALLEQLLTLDPEDRPSAALILQENQQYLQ